VINSRTGAILASHKGSYGRIVPVGNYIYSIVNESLTAEAGVYIESLSSIFSRQDLSLDFKKSFKLKSALGGQSNLLEYFEEEDRIAI
jgi:hypothetical protein